MNIEQGRPNFYRRLMAIRGDGGWITGPTHLLTVIAPEIAGLTGTIGFSVKAAGELTQDRPWMVMQVLATAVPGGLQLGIAAIREIATTGDLRQGGIHAIAALGSAAVFAGGAYLAHQAEMGMEDAQRADEEERVARIRRSSRE